MKILFAFSFICLALFSCNCHHEGNGYVYDKTNKQPMSNVRIDVYSTKPWIDTIAPKIYSDSNGYFEYAHDFCYNSMHAYIPNHVGNVFSDIKGDTIYIEYLKGN